jgi:glucose-1-phosphate adenylyltransferase
MITTLTIIMAGGRGERLYPLTRDRAKPAVRFGGIYRIIDFTLSNCLNSGIRQIYLLTQYNSVSLERHLRLGWSFFNREMGEFIETIPPQYRMESRWYAGTADSIFQNINLLQQEKPRQVLILSGDHIYKMDYQEMIDFHIKTGAEMTVGAAEIPRRQASHMGVMAVDASYRIKKFLEKPADPPPMPGKSRVSLVSMGVYVFDTEKLVRELIRDSKTNSEHDFGKNILPDMVARKEKVFAYPFKDKNQKKAKYWRDIGSLDSYWEANMDLVSVSPEFNLYDTGWPIRTYQGQYPPAKTVFANVKEGRVGQVLDSLVSGGCVVSGGRVERSILAPGVRINSYAQVEESIFMENVNVCRYARVRRAIIDKGVVIPSGFEIGYNPEEDAKRFSITSGGIVVVPSGIILEAPNK